MKLLQLITLVCFTTLINSHLFGQTHIKNYSFKKGEILDILLIKTKPGGDKLFEKYRKTAFPMAIKRTYKPMPGFNISNTTQGNIQPTSFLFGKWDDLKNREQFIAEIEDFVPDFHEQRRNIWSIFSLTYYEMPEDISFEIDKNKYTVVTSYWKKDDVSFKKFTNQWQRKSSEKKGKTILTLTEGKSPFGYYHNPDLIFITQWDSKEAFEGFYQENLDMNHSGVLHVNQFVLN